jgi:hypothetical protein
MPEKRRRHAGLPSPGGRKTVNGKTTSHGPVVRPAFVRAGSEQSGSSTAADAKNRPEKCVGSQGDSSGDELPFVFWPRVEQAFRPAAHVF